MCLVFLSPKLLVIYLFIFIYICRLEVCLVILNQSRTQMKNETEEGRRDEGRMSSVYGEGSWGTSDSSCSWDSWTECVKSQASPASVLALKVVL